MSFLVLVFHVDFLFFLNLVCVIYWRACFDSDSMRHPRMPDIPDIDKVDVWLVLVFFFFEIDIVCLFFVWAGIDWTNKHLCISDQFLSLIALFSSFLCTPVLGARASCDNVRCTPISTWAVLVPLPISRKSVTIWSLFNSHIHTGRMIPGIIYV